MKRHHHLILSSSMLRNASIYRDVLVSQSIRSPTVPHRRRSSLVLTLMPNCQVEGQQLLYPQIGFVLLAKYIILNIIYISYYKYIYITNNLYIYIYHFIYIYIYMYICHIENMYLYIYIYICICISYWKYVYIYNIMYVYIYICHIIYMSYYIYISYYIIYICHFILYIYINNIIYIILYIYHIIYTCIILLHWERGSLAGLKYRFW